MVGYFLEDLVVRERERERERESVCEGKKMYVQVVLLYLKIIKIIAETRVIKRRMAVISQNKINRERTHSYRCTYKRKKNKR